MKKNNILIIAADDHKIFTAGIISLFESLDQYTLLGTGCTGDELIALLAQHQPDVALIDISMPGASTQQIIQYSQRHTPHVKLIALTMHHDPHEARQLTDNGLDGYVLKESAFDDLIDAINVLCSGKFFNSPAIANEVAQLVLVNINAFLTTR